MRVFLAMAVVAVAGGCDFQHDLGSTTSGGSGTGGRGTGGGTSSGASTTSSGSSSGGTGASLLAGCVWQVFYPDAGSGCLLLPSSPCNGHDWALRCDGTSCNCVEDGAVYASIPQITCNDGVSALNQCPGFSGIAATTGGGSSLLGISSPSGGGGVSTPLPAGCAWYDSASDGGGCAMMPAASCQGHQDQVSCDGTSCSCIQDGTTLASVPEGDACTSFAVNTICPAFGL